METLAGIIHKKSKYLFDYKLFRIAINSKDKVTILTFTAESAMYGEDNPLLYDYELELLDNQIPFCGKLEDNIFGAQIIQVAHLHPLLWGWHFQYNELNVCTSILADDETNEKI